MVQILVENPIAFTEVISKGNQNCSGQYSLSLGDTIWERSEFEYQDQGAIWFEVVHCTGDILCG